MVIQLSDDQFLTSLAFLTYIGHRMNILNMKRQCKNQRMSQFVGGNGAFHFKLRMFEVDLKKDDLSRLPSCREFVDERKVFYFKNSQRKWVRLYC